MIRGYLSRELYYVDAKEIDGLVDSIIQDAVDIGALEYVAGEKHFRLRVSNTNRKSAEQKIENKWIDNQIDKAFYDERTKRMTALQEDIMRRDTRYPTLSEFI
jgi:hypothetical protein